MANCARPYSWNSLSLAFGGRSVHTLQSYVRYFEEAFLLFSVSRFSFKTREQSKAPRKLYCTDNGLVSSASFRFSADTGRLYENLVAIALRRLALAHRIECYYWQGERQEEVDFVVKQGRAVTALLQVCADASDPQVRRREIRSLIRAGAELKCTNRILLTESEEGEERVSWYGTRARIRVRPLWRWLQQQDLGLAEQTAEAFRTRR
jgi:predicted AAA+ superfamily ATPase